MGDKTLFIPHYISHKAPGYDPNKQQEIEHCLGSGKYCISPKYEIGADDGREILLEDIRQKCIYLHSYNKEGNKNLYWDYMINFEKNCIDKSKFNRECSYNVIDQIGFPIKKLTECLTKSFSVSKENDITFTNYNHLLDDDAEVKYKWGVKVFPTISVNNNTISGAWNSDNLLEAVCAGFKNKPTICYENGFLTDTKNDELSLRSIMLIIILVIIFNVFIIYICKRYLIKKIHERVEEEDIGGRINNVVTSYLALRDQR